MMENKLEGRRGSGQVEVTAAGFQACDDNGLNQGSSKMSWEHTINGIYDCARSGRGREESRMMCRSPGWEHGDVTDCHQRTEEEGVRGMGSRKSSAEGHPVRELCLHETSWPDRLLR